MKYKMFLLIAFLGATTFFSNCKTQKEMETAMTYSCPMHPEVTGKKGDKCPKCGMELTAPVSNAAAVYSCPMHPEVTGKKGDKCSKCSMELTVPVSNAAAVYSCPMHPEVTGKKGDKCSKCGMELQKTN